MPVTAIQYVAPAVTLTCVSGDRSTRGTAASRSKVEPVYTWDPAVPCVVTVSVANAAIPVSGATHRYHTEVPLCSKLSLNSTVDAVVSPSTQPDAPDRVCASAQRSFGWTGCVNTK